MAKWIVTWGNGTDYSESRRGISWDNAPRPRKWHLCRPWSRHHLRSGYLEHCRCGATRSKPSGPWSGKNSLNYKVAGHG